VTIASRASIMTRPRCVRRRMILSDIVAFLSGDLQLSDNTGVLFPISNAEPNPFRLSGSSPKRSEPRQRSQLKGEAESPICRYRAAAASDDAARTPNIEVIDACYPMSARTSRF